MWEIEVGVARDEVLAITSEPAELAEATIGDARAVSLNTQGTLARRGVTGTGRTQRHRARSTEPLTCPNRSSPRPGSASPTASLTAPAGSCPSTTPPPARSERKGSAGPVEFGYKVDGADNAVVADPGVKTVAIHRPGRTSATRAKTERSRSFPRLVEWRIGSESSPASPAST